MLVKVYTNREQVQPEDITLECEVLDAAGDVVAWPKLPQAAATKTGDGHADLLLWVDPLDFPAGAARVRITATDRVTGAKARSEIAVGRSPAAAAPGSTNGLDANSAMRL
ncbi:MAG: hypothetical protein AB1714_31675 [Acidobacteriota bacterium]